MDTFTIRKATPRDLEKLLLFEQGVIAAERPFDSTLKDDPINYYDLQGMIGADNVELAVAELSGEIVGSGYARIEVSKAYLKHQHYAYLGFMYVLPEYRGQGVNRKIIEHLAAWSRSRQVTELRLEVYVNNASAIKAYEKIGFQQHMLKMRLDCSSSE